MRSEHAELERRAGGKADLPCVWVSAGVLNYHLCERSYECEGCPLYQALKGEGEAAARASSPGEGAGTPLDDPVAQALARLGAGCTLHLGRAYTAEGVWLAPDVSGAVRVGMDDYTLRLLQPVDDVVLPKPGVWLRRAAPSAWLHRGRLQIPLHAPLSGEVVKVHSCPTVRPPHGDSDAERWWFVIKPHESLAMAPGLYRHEALLAWFLGRVRLVHERLSEAMAVPDAPGGCTLSDGGKPSDNLEMVLGRERFEALIGTLFPQ